MKRAVDELFETAEALFNNLNPDVIARDGNVSTYGALVNIIHTHILPEISFQQHERDAVKQALGHVERGFANVEMLINMNVQTKRNDEALLAKQRRNLLTDKSVLNLLNATPRDEHLITILLKHVEKDVRKLEDVLSVLTDKIGPLRDTEDETKAKILANIRTERDKVSKEKERSMCAREKLLNGMKRSKVKRTSTLLKKKRSKAAGTANDAEKVKYTRGTLQIDHMSNEIKQNINTKIQLSSVRQAAKLTLQEIDRSGSSFGYHRKKGSFGIDVDYDAVSEPESWTTLNEHVHIFLQINQSDIRTKHDQFCTRLMDSCRILEEKSKRNTPINYSPISTGMLDQDDPLRFSTKWLVGSDSKTDRQSICKHISKHISDTADELALEIQGEKQILKVFYKNVYICYEAHISTALMSVLSKLYEQSFRMQCEQLSGWIDRYADIEFDSINKAVQDLLPDADDSRAQTTARTTSRTTSACDSHDSRSSRNVLHVLVDRIHEQTDSLAETFERTWTFIVHRDREQSSNEALDVSFMATFEKFFTLIREENTTLAPFYKLSKLTSAVKFAEQTLSELRIENGQSGNTCADDMLDILILLLCKLDAGSLLKLYAHLNILLDLSPFYMHGTVDDYSLVTLTAAYQHLFERHELNTASVEVTHF